MITCKIYRLERCLEIVDAITYGVLHATIGTGQGITLAGEWFPGLGAGENILSCKVILSVAHGEILREDAR